MPPQQNMYTELQNPLFIHPLESFTIEDKLIGSRNYRSWKRAMEINLSSKRKLGFVTGIVTRPDDPTKADKWDTCNYVVIS